VSKDCPFLSMAGFAFWAKIAQNAKAASLKTHRFCAQFAKSQQLKANS
jgi:hypothetical protein